jgi:hypothetical protein
VDDSRRRRGPANDVAIREVVDIALGAGAAATRLTAGVARPLFLTAADLVRLGARLSHGRPPARVAHRLADRGAEVRNGLVRAATEVVRALLPRAVEAALGVIDVTDLVRAHVDLDALVKGVDVDAVVARVDLDAAVTRVDLDGVASRLDVDAVIARADLDRVVSRIDVDAIIAGADLDRVVSRIDVDAILERVDPDDIVARVDVEAVLDRLDLTAIARQVIESIDLAAIMREASGVASSQVARSVRTEGMHADESVARFVDRVLRRPHHGGEVTP